MFFKKAGKAVFGVQLNDKEQKVLDAEIAKQVVEMNRQFEIDQESSVLWMLREHFGFGPERLKRAWQLFYEGNKQLYQHYEMGPEDGGWLCRRKLLDIGCDIEAWYGEEEANREDKQAR